VSGGSASTSNTSVAVSDSGTYYWLAEYSGDATHKAVNSCAESTQVAITNGLPVSSF
jgi:hypothetical protein